MPVKTASLSRVFVWFLVWLVLQGILLLTYISLSLPTFGDTPITTNNSQVEKTIKNLGIKDENITSDLEQLKSNPHQAVRLLVMELHPIPQNVYYESLKTTDSRHIIACLRALHCLTGLTFSATSAKPLTDDEKQFLDFKNEMHDYNPDHKLHFFGVWMSHNADFVAPLDAQEKIIQQWKEWQHEHGDSFKYSPSANRKNSMDEWFWFG